MDFDQLLEKCESEIEKHLLKALYPTLGPHSQAESMRPIPDRRL